MYRTQGVLNESENFTGAEISRAFSIREALPYLNGYLFKLGGILIPKVHSIPSYLVFITFPLLVGMGINTAVRRSFDGDSVSSLMILVLVVFFFHIMFLFFINHAVVHPWMDCRHMLFCLAIGWGLLFSRPFLFGQSLQSLKLPRTEATEG